MSAETNMLFKIVLMTDLAYARLQKFSYRCRPAGLMGSTDATTVIPVKIFEEGDVFFKVSIVIQLIVSAIEGTLPTLIF